VIAVAGITPVTVMSSAGSLNVMVSPESGRPFVHWDAGGVSKVSASSLQKTRQGPRDDNPL
jgi:hypothetical protein